MQEESVMEIERKFLIEKENLPENLASYQTDSGRSDAESRN